jgi:hypothetical protein
MERVLDALEPDDVRRFLRLHLALVEGRAHEPPERSESAWQRIAGVRCDRWPAFLDRLEKAGVLARRADGRVTGPWAERVYAQRVRESDRNRANRGAADARSAGGHRAVIDPLSGRYRVDNENRPPDAVEKGETDQGVWATADQRPFAKEKEKEEVEERPLNPTGENAGGVEGEWLGRDEGPLPQSLQMLVDLCADGRHIEVVDRLLRPILQARRFSDSDKLSSLLSLRDSAKDLSGEQLEKAAQLVLALRFRTIKRERIAEVIEQVRKAGAMVVIYAGTPQWDAWIVHWQRTQPKLAKLAAGADKWQAPAKWPPANDRVAHLVGVAE